MNIFSDKTQYTLPELHGFNVIIDEVENADSTSMPYTHTLYICINIMVCVYIYSYVCVCIDV